MNPIVDPKILIGVCVHDRIKNIERWLGIYRHMIKPCPVKLMVIHNRDTPEPTPEWARYIDDPRMDFFIHRQNGGYDVGTMQDFLKGRLGDPWPEWNVMLWATDDTLPMKRDSISILLDTLQQDGVGAAGIEESHMIKYHLRTNFYMTRREHLEQLTFPFDPVTTKMESYHFEHRCDTHSLTNQLKRMGLSVKQVNPNIHHAAWDTQHHAGSSGNWRKLWRSFPNIKMLGTEPK